MNRLPEPLIILTKEVQAALDDRRAVVALESSVIAQGLPAPHNLESARACEKAIRAEGAVPATIALIDGIVRVGLSPAELERLASEKDLLKLGARDLGVGVAKRGTGGTTVSGTLAVADAVGIEVFATGGIGGAHRGDVNDVSADLHALAKYPLAVVCAGAKAILDLPRTLELLETLGVPVVGLRTGELPAFYCRTSHLPLEARVESEEELAFLYAAHRELGPESAVLCVQCCPDEVALAEEEVERAIEAALREASRLGIRGKRLTPFLLGAVSASTQGRARVANLALLENNARTAARLAQALVSRGI